MIELQNVCKNYQTPQGEYIALQNVSLKVLPGEIYGIIGKSGAGKSTLIRCVNLLERPTSGKVYIADREITHLSDAELRNVRHRVGMIFQHFNLLNTRTVYENIALPLELVRTPPAHIKHRVDELLELVHLAEKKHSYPADLSGGQKQRVAIARALACKPDILLCDEATSALDLHTTNAILALLKDINVKLKLSILLITHEMAVIKEICDRVALLDKGAIVEENRIYDFFTRPELPLTRKFIKASLKYDLPLALEERLLKTANAGANAVLRIIFHGQAAYEPFISHLAQQLGVKLNILQANIEFLQKDPLGIMVVEIINPQEKLAQIITYLNNNHLNVELLGYVNADHH